MKNSYRFCFWIIGLSIVLVLKGNGTCLNDVLTIYNNYHLLQKEILNHKMLYANCSYTGKSVKVNGKDTSLVDFRYTYNIFLGKKIRRIVADNFQFYDNSVESFYVVKDLKEIYNNKSTVEYSNKLIEGNLFYFQEDMYKRMKLVSCRNIENIKGRESNSISSKAVSDLEVKVKLKQYVVEKDDSIDVFITYLVNTKAQKINQVKIFNPSPEADMREVNIIYNRMEVLPDTMTNFNIRRFFFDEKGKLLSKYRGYEYIDLRHKNIKEEMKE